MKKKNLWAVVAIFFMLISNGAVSAALQSIMEAFPDAPVSSVYLILSLPTIFIMIASYISGILTAKRVPYKRLAIISLILLTVTGVCPFFLNSVNNILVTRALFGFAVGLINPMGNTLAVLYFGPEEGGRVIGYGNTSMNLGCIAGQMLAGFLCGINWRYTFLAYLMGLIPLVIVLFNMQEPQAAENPQERAPKVKIPASVYLLGILMMLGQLFIYPLYLNLSSVIMLDIPGGTPALAGIALSIVNVAGMLVGVLFGKIYKSFGRFTIAISTLAGFFGLFMVGTSGSLAGILIASAFCGVCNTLLLVGIMNEVGLSVAPEAMSQSSGVVMAFCAFAPLLATVYTTLVGKIPGANPARTIFVSGAIGCAVLTVVWVLTHLKKKQ